MYKRELGISRREWRILAYLARTPDASLKALAADAGIDVVVASRTVADMHSRGLVDKRRSPGNKRLVCLRLRVEREGDSLRGGITVRTWEGGPSQQRPPARCEGDLDYALRMNATSRA